MEHGANITNANPRVEVWTTHYCSSKHSWLVAESSKGAGGAGRLFQWRDKNLHGNDAIRTPGVITVRIQATTFTASAQQNSNGNHRKPKRMKQDQTNDQATDTLRDLHMRGCGDMVIIRTE